MDTNVTVAENNCQTSCSNHGSKSVESSMKIGCISIDLTGGNEKTSAQKCEHFSIRGFVSEVRKKDWKMCWPFTLDGDMKHHGDQTCVLPPLHVPRFKYWRCENCLHELEAKRITNNQRLGLKLQSSELKSSKSCTHVSPFSDAIRLLSNVQAGTKPDSPAGKILNGDVSSNLNNETTEFQPLVRMDLKEKSSNAMSSPKGNGMRSKAKCGQEISKLATVAIEATSSPEQKACFTGKKASEAKRHGRDIPCRPGYDAIKDTSSTGREDSVCQQLKVPTAAVTSGEAEDREEGPYAPGRSLMDKHPSVGVDICDDDTSSKSTETLIRNYVEDFSNDDSSNLPQRRKTRKVRLLAELLGGSGDRLVASNSKSQDSQLNEVSDVSAGVEKLPLDDQAGNCKRGLGHGKKRKPPQDENGRPTEISFPNKEDNNGSMMEKDVEETDATAMTEKDMEATDATANTEDIELAFARMKLYLGKKNQSIKERVDRSPCIGGKKKQKIWSFGEGLPASTLSLDIAAKETRDKPGYQSPSTVNIDSVSNAYKTREMDLFPLPARTLEPGHGNDKMKSKPYEVINPRASQIVWNNNIYREGPIARKDRDVSCSGSAGHQFCFSQDVSLDKALNLCLNSYTPLQKIDFKCYPQLEERRNTPVTWQEGPSRGSVRKASDVKYVENFGNVPRPTPTASTGRSGVLSSKKPDVYSMPYLNEKQNYASPVQIGNRAMNHKQELCSGQGKSTGVHDSVSILKGGNNLAAGKGSEQGAVDFPMEVVELMAKNQYERSLPDSEYNKHQVESPICTKNVQMIDFSKVCTHRELSFSKQEDAQKQMRQTKPARSGANVGSTIQKPVDFFAQADRNKVRTGQQKQAPLPVGFNPFLEHQDKPSGRFEHSPPGSSKQNSAHARQWIEDVTWKMPACAGYSNARSCNTCQSIPQQKKESKQPWSPLATNQTTFVYKHPQNGAGLSTNFLAGSSESPRKMNTNSFWDLKLLSQSTPNLGKQTRNIVSEITGGTRVGLEVNKKAVASSDPYSNETIPAMHLLSLMDAGRSSSSPVSMDENHKFLKRPPVAPPKKATGAYRTSNTMNMPPYGKSQFAESCEPIPGVPDTFGISTCSFQNERNFKRTTNFTSQASEAKEKRKGPDICMSNNIHKLQTSASASVPFGANCGSIPVHSMHALFSAAPNPKAIPSQLVHSRNLKQKLDIPSAVAPVNHHKSDIKIEVCTINRNPADFTVPEARNVYMIAGEDLKFPMSVPSAKGTGVGKPGRKRRPRMVATGEDKGQPSAS